jgi:arthrofactin-type cyclic lipopeptide synthetase C
VQRFGPYRIAGWSFGGSLAYEIATQLLGEDETVEFLGLLDTVNHTGIGPKERPSHDDNTVLLNIVLQMMDGTDDALRAQLESLAKTTDLETFASACREKQLLPPNMEDIRNYIVRMRASIHALYDYHPLSVPIPIHLFRAMDEQKPDRDDYLGWAQVLPQAQIRVIAVPGTHFSVMLPPHIDVLGRLLTDAIRQADAAKKTIPAQDNACLVSIQTGTGAMEPVFCVPGAGASITDFTHMATALGGQWPVHGLQPRGLNNGDVPHATVPAAARQYVRAVDDVYPQGPLHLIGHSFGGWVVFEMALRLHTAGRKVASVTLVDTQAPDSVGVLGREYSRTEMFMKLIELSEQRAACSLNLDADDFDGLDYEAQLKRLHGRLVAVEMVSRRSTPDVLRGMVRTFATNLQTSFLPSEAYPGPMRLVLVRTATDDEATCRKKHRRIAAGWQRFAPELVTWRGPGNHMTILKPPHVAALVDWLSASLCGGKK